MEIQNLGGIGKIGLDSVKIQETAPEKAAGKTSDFEKVRMEKLAKEEEVTGMKADDIGFNENILSRTDVKQVQNDFLHQVQNRGEGKELDVLSEHLASLGAKVDNARTALPSVEKSGFSSSVENYFKETETRFKNLDTLTQELTAGDRQYSLQDLLKMQVQMQTVSQNLEILSKVIDKVDDGLKTLLRTQV